MSVVSAGVEQALLGVSYGWQFIQDKNKEDEIKQGKTYYLASLLQSGLLFTLGALVEEVATTASLSPLSQPAAFLCTWGPWIHLPVGLLIASVKHGDYEALAETRWGWMLPRRLSERTVVVLQFFAREILRPAFVTAANED